MLFDVCLPNLESALDGGKKFLCGYDFTLADIAYYNEMTTVLGVLEMKVD